MSFNFKKRISPAESRQIFDLVKNVKGWTSRQTGELLWHFAANCQSQEGAIVEIGSWKGRSTIWLAKGSQKGSGKKVYAVDPHTGSAEHIEKYGSDINTYTDFLKNIEQAGVKDLVIPVRKTGAEFSKEFKNPVELIFIDGDHSYEGVCEDFKNWFPKMVEGGIMVFDDTQDWPGPRRLVKNEVFLSRYFRNVGFVGPVTYGQKVSKNSLRDILRNRWVLFLKDTVYLFVYSVKIKRYIPQSVYSIFRRLISIIQ